jgi:lysylphosphatidylglycerol synthetase-like protein (DUF2156 family)
MVLGDLLLPAEATPSSTVLAGDLALTLERWSGPGTVVICGRLFEPPCPDGPDPSGPAVAAHPALAQAMAAFTGEPDRHLLVVGPAGPGCGPALDPLGVERVPALDLLLETASGPRRVEVRAAEPTARPLEATEEGAGRPWLTGLDRLEDPEARRRFVTSRLLYRRLGRYLWLPPLVLVALALLLRLEFVFDTLSVVVRGAGPRRALSRAYEASWPDRLLVTGVIVVALLAVVALVVALASRGIWRALGGGELGPPPPGTASPELDEARRAVAAGATGRITGGGLRAELTHLDPGFSARPGAVSEVVREHRGRFGLPPVFLHHRHASWIEIETGADLHVRLLLADADLPGSRVIERLVSVDTVVKGRQPVGELHPALVASWPRGAAWPPAPEVAADRVRVRRMRRLAAAGILLAGLGDLLWAVTPPLRPRLHEVEQFLPLGVAQAAGALVALAGIGLLMLARGVLRGQRRSWGVSIALLVASLVLHLIHGIFLLGFALSALVLILLVVRRADFRAESDAGSLRSALTVLVVGAVVATVAATVAVEISGHVRHHQLPAWPRVLLGSAERLVGLQWVAFPAHIDRFVAPSLLAVGIGLAVVVLFLLTRPVVDRELSVLRGSAGRRAAERRARDIVRRHGTGTLDYFALRDDKQWFFHRDSLVAYAVYGGVCLVSPDPIGPRGEQRHVWDAFRRFADAKGWAIGLMAGGEDWLPIYRDSGMRYLYIGDEAVVDVQNFSLQGGKMKGLRQAVNRVERYGYTVAFHDPAQADPDLVAALVDLMGRHSRGEQERGFSMMLGRLFDPRDTGLLLTVVTGPDGLPVALCQFVPSQAIRGFSLDLMRRDPGEHPNGLLDFALCRTIEHLAAEGARGLSLNFAAMRSVLEGESGDGVTQRVERWALKRLSGVLQIESLWRFNAKYEPSWLPRYIVYDSPELFVPTAVQIMRAESLTEMPVVGRLLNTSRRGAPLVPAGRLDAGNGAGVAGGRDGERS